VWTLEENQSQRRWTQNTVIYSVVRPMPTPRCGDLLRSRIALNPSQVIQWSTWVPRLSSFVDFSHLRGISTSWSLSPLQCWSHKKHRSKGGKATHARLNPQHTHAHKPRFELKTRHRKFTTQTELKSLTQQSKYMEAESRSLKMFRECLVFCSMRLGVPFIAPRQLGAIEDQLGRQILPSVEWCTGQSGAPPNMNSSCPVLDFLPYRAQPTVGPLGPLAQRTLSGAHRTVRCDHPTVGSATCRPFIVQMTVGRGRLWLTGQSSAPPDSPLIFSHSAFSFSREWRVRRRSLGRGRWWLTEQSGAPLDSPVIYSHVAPAKSREQPVCHRASLGTGHCPVRHRLVLVGWTEPNLLHLFYSFLGYVSST
jgi:hypothetical protein